MRVVHRDFHRRAPQPPFHCILLAEFDFVRESLPFLGSTFILGNKEDFGLKQFREVALAVAGFVILLLLGKFKFFEDTNNKSIRYARYTA